MMINQEHARKRKNFSRRQKFEMARCKRTAQHVMQGKPVPFEEAGNSSTVRFYLALEA